MRAAFAVLLVTVAAGCQAEVLAGRIVGITDGDTLTLLDEANVQYKIRLAEIDAPEKGQPFGQRAKQALAELCFQKPATARPVASDRYGRTVARVICNGRDANADQVRTGMAWVYDRYVTERTLYQLQDEARSAGRGLWAAPDPVPPWVWRKR